MTESTKNVSEPRFQARNYSSFINSSNVTSIYASSKNPKKMDSLILTSLLPLPIYYSTRLATVASVTGIKSVFKPSNLASAGVLTFQLPLVHGSSYVLNLMFSKFTNNKESSETSRGVASGVATAMSQTMWGGIRLSTVDSAASVYGKSFHESTRILLNNLEGLFSKKQPIHTFLGGARWPRQSGLFFMEQVVPCGLGGAASDYLGWDPLNTKLGLSVGVSFASAYVDASNFNKTALTAFPTRFAIKSSRNLLAMLVMNPVTYRQISGKVAEFCNSN